MQMERAPHHPDDDYDAIFDFCRLVVTRKCVNCRSLLFHVPPTPKRNKKKKTFFWVLFLLFRFNFLPTAEFTDGPTLQVHWLPAFVLTSAVFSALEKLISSCFFLRRPFLVFLLFFFWVKKMPRHGRPSLFLLLLLAFSNERTNERKGCETNAS